MKCAWLLFFLTGCLFAAGEVKIPDGAWNGKPWKRNLLLSEVKKGNPDALAEWAYCSRRALLQIAYDRNLICKRAKIAGDKGSLLGKRMFAKSLRHGEGIEPDKKRSHQIFKQLAQQNCPDAMVDLASDYFFGEVVDKDVEQAEKWLKKADSYNCVRSASYWAMLYTSKEYPGYDPRKAASINVEVFMKYDDIFCAGEIHYKSLYQDKKSYAGLVTKEILDQVSQRLQQGVTLNHPNALFRQSWHELQRGDKNLAITLMIRAANVGSPSAMRNVTIWLENDLTVRDENNERQLLAIGDHLTRQKTAEFAYNHGERSETVVRTYANQLSRFKGKGYEAKHKEALKLFRGQLKTGVCGAHDSLGMQHLQEHEEFKGTQKDSDLGFAHLIYHSTHSRDACWYLALFHMSEPHSTSYNLPKGIAVCKNTMNIMETKSDRFTQRMKRWIEKEKTLKPQQKEELDQLVKDGFPTSEKFRRPAFELIKKSGDLPADWKFNQRYPKK